MTSSNFLEESLIKKRKKGGRCETVTKEMRTAKSYIFIV